MKRFKCINSKQNELTSLVACSNTKPSNQSFEMVGGSRNCSLNIIKLDKWINNSSSHNFEYKIKQTVYLAQNWFHPSFHRDGVWKWKRYWSVSNDNHCIEVRESQLCSERIIFYFIFINLEMQFCSEMNYMSKYVVTTEPTTLIISQWNLAYPE
jgi:hypothetical protein